MARMIARAARTALIFIGICVLVVLLASAAIASFSDWPFNEAFGTLVLLGGVMLMFGGTMSGAGGAERGAQNAAYMTGGHRANYYEQYKNERQSRRDSQFWYMLLMVAAGALLIAVGLMAIG